jgi:hypothetical protein
VAYDPNLKEFSGTHAFPNQLWHPLDVGKNRELLEQIGVISPEDDSIPENLHDSVFFAVWSNFQLMGRSTRKEVVQKLLSE